MMRAPIIVGVRFVLLAVGLVMIAPAAHSADPQAPYDLEGETAWARATWPMELAGLRFDSVLPQLRRWAPTGESLVVYVRTPDDACRKIELGPSRVELAGELYPYVVLVGRVEVPFPGGRSFDELRVGDELARWPDVKNQVRDAEGNWTGAASTSDGEPTTYGTLSQVDDAVVRFGGRSVELHPTCLDPHEWAPCAGGGGRYCQRCEQIGVRVIDLPSSLGGEHFTGPRPETCHDKCPASPDNPVAARLRELARHVSIWRPGTTAPDKVPSVYRARETCLREQRRRSTPKN